MVSVISPAGPLAGYHAWALRVLRRADFAEKSAFRRGHNSAKNLSALAPRMLFHLDLRHRKPFGRIELLPSGTKPESAFRNNPDSAPGGIHRLENLVYEFARCGVSFPVDSPAVRVFNFSPPAFNLVDKQGDALQNVQGFEARNNTWCFVFIHDFLISPGADYDADMTRA